MKWKKAALLFAAAVLLWPAMPCRAAEPAATDGVLLPVLMYHQVKPLHSGKDAIRPEEFERDLQYLAAEGYTTVTVQDLLDYVYEGVPLPEKPIMITFDDGYWNNYLYVLPLIQKYNVKIVLSLIGKDADDFTQYHGTSVDYAKMTWDQIGEMVDTGLVELQNHTYNLHGSTSRIGCTQPVWESDEAYVQTLTEDVQRLQEDIFRRTGRAPAAFAYPYGKFSDLTDEVLEELGIRATLSCRYGINIITRDPDCLWRLMRVCRAHGQSAEKVLTEAYKTLQ